MQENQSDKKDHNFLSDNRITLLAHFKKAFKLGIENAVLFIFVFFYFLILNIHFCFISCLGILIFFQRNEC
jgi:hypothetical protein